MTTVTNVNHVTVMKELRNVDGVKLLAIRRGDDQVGFALSSKPDSVVIQGKKTFNRVNLDSVKYWSIPEFSKIKAKYESTELFFDAVTDMMS